jgi:hypothetical protein
MPGPTKKRSFVYSIRLNIKELAALTAWCKAKGYDTEGPSHMMKQAIRYVLRTEEPTWFELAEEECLVYLHEEEVAYANALRNRQAIAAQLRKQDDEFVEGAVKPKKDETATELQRFVTLDTLHKAGETTEAEETEYQDLLKTGRYGPEAEETVE